jgi:flavin reductase (DIM6/NTAB) family NADH-FMN oxidoreductase RutF
MKPTAAPAVLATADTPPAETLPGTAPPRHLDAQGSGTRSAPRRAAAPDFDADLFRAVLGQFATGVTIITTRSAEGALVGITASSFNSVSLSPPLVLWSLGTQSSSMAAFQANTHYVINVLSAAQVDLCMRFARSKGDRFEGVSYQLTPSGIPILDGALAWFECHNRSRYAEGDHVIFVGEVERCSLNANLEQTDPLVFHGGRFHTIDTLD